MFAREVRIAVPEGVLPPYPYFVRVEKIGQYIPGVGRVVYCRPRPPCVITPATRVEYVRECELKFEELRNNVLLTVKYTRDVKYYIYPRRVWEIVWSRYISPMLDARPPRDPGLLLYGPRGTGKTSLILTIADALGLHVVNVDASILSRYFGETEQRFMQKLLEAEINEPSLVNMDEQDYLVMKRQYSGGSDDAASFTHQAILSIVLRKMPEYKREKRLILIILATNLSPDRIDDALLRHERFGKPVFVPLPDYEAVRTLMRLRGVDEILGERETDRLASKLASVGINMADLVDIIDEIREKGTVPDISRYAQVSKGYRRPYPADLVEVPEQLKNMLKLRLSERSRLYVYASFPVGEAVLVTVLAHLNVPVVVLTDERYLDEAVHTAETCQACLIVSTEHVSEQAQKLIYLNAKCPVVYVGRALPQGTRPDLDQARIVDILKPEGVLKLVCKYYGVEYADQDIRDLARTQRLLERALEEIAEKGVRKLSEYIQQVRKYVL